MTETRHAGDTMISEPQINLMARAIAEVLTNDAICVDTMFALIGDGYDEAALTRVAAFARRIAEEQDDLLGDDEAYELACDFCDECGMFMPCDHVG